MTEVPVCLDWDPKDSSCGSTRIEDRVNELSEFLDGARSRM